jgi:hypothetical protein
MTIFGALGPADEILAAAGGAVQWIGHAVIKLGESLEQISKRLDAIEKLLAGQFGEEK